VAADEDYVLLDFAAADGRFAGSTELYGSEHGQDLARGLRGFPLSPADERRVELGSADAKVAGGYVQINARCVDRAGHSLLTIAIMDKSAGFSSAGRHVMVALPVEPPALDAFVTALQGWDLKPGSSITLPGAT
jgi:hypothetical protein